MTQLCVAPCLSSRKKSWVPTHEMGLGPTAPYLSNLAIAKEHRRIGAGKAIVDW
ncbi:hypothetical protein T484DRAFT_1850003 [Baffinella frigidus]|nr:hypothetical protein T484DRAFT_1850003 [Cryptophyta sp. CCMP2293]